MAEGFSPQACPGHTGPKNRHSKDGSLTDRGSPGVPGGPPLVLPFLSSSVLTGAKGTRAYLQRHSLGTTLPTGQRSRHRSSPATRPLCGHARPREVPSLRSWTGELPRPKTRSLERARHFHNGEIPHDLSYGPNTWPPARPPKSPSTWRRPSPDNHPEPQELSLRRARTSPDHQFTTTRKWHTPMGTPHRDQFTRSITYGPSFWFRSSFAVKSQDPVTHHTRSRSSPQQ